MLHFLYVIYCLLVFAYTGNAVITGDRALAFFALVLVEFLIELVLLILRVIFTTTKTKLQT